MIINKASQVYPERQSAAVNAHGTNKTNILKNKKDFKKY